MEEFIITDNTETDPLIAINQESNILDNATLAFFTNPMYLNTLKRKNLLVEKDNTSDVKFYRKRIISLFKDLLKGEEEPPTKELKEIYNVFVNTAIKYFERVDTKDIIQEQYHKDVEEEEGSAKEDLLNNIGGKDLFTIDEANDIMMRKTINVASLDNYIIFPKQDISGNQLRVIPLKMEIDLKTPDLKTKGVKTKIKKSKL